MKTYIIVMTERTQPVNAWPAGKDFAVFDYLPEVEKFCKGETSHNTLDDCTQLFPHEEVRKVICILAEGPISAYNRAFEYMK